jgi:hypothetical protein
MWKNYNQKNQYVKTKCGTNMISSICTNKQNLEQSVSHNKIWNSYGKQNVKQS